LNQDESVAISGGRFLRKDSARRNWVTVDGAPGPKRHRDGTEIPRLPEVLAQHAGSIRLLHTLRPFAVVMAGTGEIDPFNDQFSRAPLIF
jgi:tRNA-splicing ligase RtcB (3'-phosphate/5'-hydroxy nucleic acid ligase)